MKVLVACEYSATVRDAFRARGFDAWSCDLLPTEGDPRWHVQGDVLPLLGAGWDLLIAHPPCTHLAVSGARWFKDKRKEQAEALEFVRKLLDAPIPHIALENPVSVISSKIRKPDCTFQPWEHGHGEVKRTCLWLKNLPVLKPSNIVEGREAKVHKMPPGPDRWKERSRTYRGVAEAMADQWGDYISRAHLSSHARDGGGTTPRVASNSLHDPARSLSDADRLAGPDLSVSHNGTLSRVASQDHDASHPSKSPREGSHDGARTDGA